MQRATEAPKGNRIIITIGAPKQGKTVLSGTISKFAPNELPAQAMTHLSDTVFIQIDSGGVSSLKYLNLDPNVIDLSSHVSFKEFIPAFNAAIKEIRVAIDAGQISFVVLDTLTALDKLIVNEQKKLYDDNRIWNAILGKHMDFALALKSLPCTVIVTCHTRYMGAFAGAESAEEQARKKARAMPGRAEIGMACTPSAADYWKTQADAILPVYVIQDGKQSRRVVLTAPSRGFECGHRFQGLEEEEPAHLRKLLQKAGAYAA